MSDRAVPLLNEETPKKKAINWAFYSSLFLSVIAIILGLSGYLKKVTMDFRGQL